MRLEDYFTFRTVRKKLLFISKLAGLFLIFSYVILKNAEVDSDVSFLLWMFFIIILVLCVDFLMGYFISKPISKLNQAARRMAELDFSEPCIISTNDEFGELSASLGIMAENLQKSLVNLEAANMQLAKEVEKERRLLAERKELADRISHEMKTPLGVIRAYAEGLQDGTDEAEKQKYSEIIIAETERMSGLISTLLDLSALENGAAQLTPERFDFVEFLEIVAGRLLVDVPDACYELRYELPEQRLEVDTDKARMEQVMDNLIVNAKNHVRRGGILKLSLTEQAGAWRFSIYNQGPVIPEENLSKIWTKFYKERDSKYNGSGLGLAIVAQILSMQDLEYGAENLEDGVQFFFTLPSVS